LNMRVYSPTGKSYVHIVEIPRDEIDEISVEQCAQPKETLKSFYSRQTKKPDILMNGSLFGMSGGIPCFGLIIDSKVVANDGARIWGIGVTGSTNVSYGKIDAKNWKSWISGYPVLIENGNKNTITDARELDYKARRSIWGISTKNVYLVTVDSPGMNFSDMQTLMHDLECTAAINLDGGGSTRCMVNGDTITNGLENRQVDNVITVYLKSETTTQTTETSKEPVVNTHTEGGKTLKIYEDIIQQNGGKVRPGTKRDKKWIVIHETGNRSHGSNAKGHSDYLKSLAVANNTYISWHYTVDDECAYHHIPDDEVAWHASDGSKEGGGNMAGIGIEICVNSDGDFAKARDNAAWLTAKLLKEHGLNMSAVKQHYDFAPNKKNCPETIRNKGLWNSFLAAVQKYYGGTSSNNTVTSTTASEFRVGDIVQFTGTKHYTWADAPESAGKVCLPGKAKVTQTYRVGNSKHPYMVVAVSGGGSTVYGWVDAKDLQEIEKEGFKAYTAKVTATVLNVRSGPGNTYKVNTTVRKNEIYTIVEEKNGWGRLKSNSGWVYLKYMKFVKNV
jgi:N-acetylmuramoyl-L-alanine amidase